MSSQTVSTEAAARRGRKPIGDKAMSAAERKRLSRERQNKAGSVEFVVRLNGGTLNLIDQLVIREGAPSRSDLVEVLLDMAVAKLGLAIARAELVRERGGAEDEAAKQMSELLSSTPAPHEVAKFKEVMGLR